MARNADEFVACRRTYLVVNVQVATHLGIQLQTDRLLTIYEVHFKATLAEIVFFFKFSRAIDP